MLEKPYMRFSVSLALVLLTAACCSWFNRVGMAWFYPHIERSALTPPDYVFPIVWLILYVLLVLAFDRILSLPPTENKPAVLNFIFNMFLQVLWTYVFFYKGSFLLGFVVLVVLDFATAVLFEQFYKLQRAAGYLLVPYMMWLLFATYLNWMVVQLNGNVYGG